MFGATDGELEEANRMASETAKYSSYLHGLQVALDDFKKQADEIGRYRTGAACRSDESEELPEAPRGPAGARYGRPPAPLPLAFSSVDLTAPIG